MIALKKGEVLTGIHKSDLVLIDEADAILFDRGYVPPLCAGVIGLTATSLQQEGGTDEVRLTNLKIKLFNSGIQASTNPEQTVVHGEEVAAAFEAVEHQHQSVFDHTEPDKVHQYTSLAQSKGYSVVVDEQNIDQLRSLKPQCCIIQTDLDLMRGVDYQDEQQAGIALIVDTQYPNERAYLQALGRVGRKSQRCRRFVVPARDNVVNRMQHAKQVQ